METFIMFRDLMGKVFPADWMVMNLVQIQVFLRAINQYSDVLNMYFMEKAHFHQQVRVSAATLAEVRHSTLCQISKSNAGEMER